MNAAVLSVISNLPRVEFEIDDDGFVTSANPILPPVGEIILQTIASAVIFYLLFKFAGPAIKAYYAARTERIQNELDTAANARTEAEAEAQRIRTSLGDIEAERARFQVEAEQQAEAMLSEGRVRIAAEAAELLERADAEIAGLAGRSGDELRGEIARHATRAVEVAVIESLDEAAHQQLIEDFISRVGAGIDVNGVAR